MVKLRAFPKDSVWKQSGTVAPDIVTGQEVERIIKKPQYASLNPRGTGMPYVTHCKTVYIGKEMGRLMMIATLICIIVMLLMTKSFRGIVAPIISVIGGLFITYGIAGFTQMYVDSTVLMIPTILAFAVAGRQGLLKLVDDLGLDIGMGRRDATQPSDIPKPGSPSNGLRAAQPGSSAPPRALPPRRLALQKSSSRQLAVQACSCAS